MEKEIIEKIEIKLIEIMELIEKQKGFPMLEKNVETYVNTKEENKKLYNIYRTVSNLRHI